MKSDNDPSTLKQIIDPHDLLRAIENSVKYSDDTCHGVTGLTFKNYTITVHKRKTFCWHIECKFKPVPVEAEQGRHIRRVRRRLEHDNNAKDNNGRDLR
jgi:hypothetical protein